MNLQFPSEFGTTDYQPIQQPIQLPIPQQQLRQLQPQPIRSQKEAVPASDSSSEDLDLEEDTQSSLQQSNTKEASAYIKSLSEDQLARYESFRRAKLSKTVMKKVVGGIVGFPVSAQTSFIIAGISKVFVGEIVERAMEVREDWGESAEDIAITPAQLKEAYRRYSGSKTRISDNPRVLKERLFD